MVTFPNLVTFTTKFFGDYQNSAIHSNPTQYVRQASTSLIWVTITDVQTGDSVIVTSANNVIPPAPLTPPTVTITGAPVTSPEVTGIILGSTVTDPRPADTTFTYAWNVTRNGNHIVASGSGANFTFTPDYGGTYVVSLMATDTDGSIGTAATQTILLPLWRPQEVR